MKKSQTPCVQHLSATFAGCFPVHLIANDGITDRMEMDPNLVGSSGEDLAKDEGPTARFLDDFELYLSRPPTVDNSHFFDSTDQGIGRTVWPTRRTRSTWHQRGAKDRGDFRPHYPVSRFLSRRGRTVYRREIFRIGV